jgi:hypothetical protein
MTPKNRFWSVWPMARDEEVTRNVQHKLFLYPFAFFRWIQRFAFLSKISEHPQVWGRNGRGREGVEWITLPLLWPTWPQLKYILLPCSILYPPPSPPLVPTLAHITMLPVLTLRSISDILPYLLSPVVPTSVHLSTVKYPCYYVQLDNVSYRLNVPPLLPTTPSGY